MGNQADKNRQNPKHQQDQRRNPQSQPQDGRQQQAEQNRQPQPGGARPDPNRNNPR
jgi:hypothetical protein